MIWWKNEIKKHIEEEGDLKKVPEKENNLEI